MTTMMTRRALAGLAGVAAVALAGSRLTLAHGDDDHGTPMAEASPHAMAHGSGTAAAWCTITNRGTTDDRLVSARSEIAAATEIHEMAMKDGSMKMAPLPDGLAIPAGQTVVLEPGGYHIMFVGLTRDLIAGESFELTLTFEQAGEVTLTVPILKSQDDADQAELQTVEHGDLEIAGIWSRQAPALMNEQEGEVAHGSGTAAAWCSITNHGDSDDRLVSARSEIAAATEIHEMVMKDGSMQMSPLPDGIVLPAGETVTLEPGGLHIMHIGLTRDLKAGENYDLTLTFEHAGEIEVSVPVFMSESAAERAELETVTHGDLEISGLWTRHAPALMDDQATPVASPSH